MTTRGILTACNDDPRFRRTLAALVRSCRDKSIPITVVDHGMARDYARALVKRGARVVRKDVRYAANMDFIGARHFGTPRAPLEAWWKPLVCMAAAPYDHTIWIDADAILLRGEEEMFGVVATHGSFLTRDWWVAGERAKFLYKPVITALFGEDGVPVPDDATIAHRCHLNSGVFGWQKDAPWLRHWAETCNRITSNPALLRLSKCRDQTGLAAWMARGHPDSPPIMESAAWNYPANGLSARDRAARRKYPAGADLITEAAKDHPEAFVVHWLGNPKP
jgi:hypothetical protein